MKILTLLLFLVFVFSGCEKAKFVNGGDSKTASLGDQDVIEVIHDDEAESNEMDEPDETDTGAEEDDEEENYEEEEDDRETTGENDNDGETKRHCRATPDEVYRDKKIRQRHHCGKNKKDHKILICKWPAGDESKEKTLCVAQASLENEMGEQRRRQDQYFVGICPSELPEDERENEEEGEEE